MTGTKEGQIGKRGRNDFAMNVKHFAQLFAAVLEVTHDVRQCDNHQIADRVPGDVASVISCRQAHPIRRATEP